MRPRSQTEPKLQRSTRWLVAFGGVTSKRAGFGWQRPLCLSPVPATAPHCSSVRAEAPGLSTTVRGVRLRSRTISVGISAPPRASSWPPG